MPSKLKVVIAGCGEMGLPMARCLLVAGVDVNGYDVRPKDQFEEFAGRMLYSADCIRRCDVMLSVVRDEGQTNDLLFGRQGVYNNDQYPETLVICSTLSPRYVHRIKKRLPANVDLIDAPMSGASHAARSGALSFMIGGNAAVIQRLLPLFQAMGDRIFTTGELGSGMTMKVLNNYVAAASVCAVRRALEAAQKLDADQGKLLEIMSASSGGTWFGNQFEQIEWSRNGYTEDNTIGILEKDVRAAIDAIEGDSAITENPLDQSILATLRHMQPLKDDQS